MQDKYDFISRNNFYNWNIFCSTLQYMRLNDMSYLYWLPYLQTRRQGRVVTRRRRRTRFGITRWTPWTRTSHGTTGRWSTAASLSQIPGTSTHSHLTFYFLLYTFVNDWILFRYVTESIHSGPKILLPQVQFRRNVESYAIINSVQVIKLSTMNIAKQLKIFLQSNSRLMSR